MAENPLDLTTWVPVAIADSASDSTSINVQGWDIVAIEQPADCEGTTIKFKGSLDPGAADASLVAVVDNGGSDVSVTKSATAAQVIQLGSKVIQGLGRVLLTTGSAQSGAATLKVGLRKAA